MGGWGEAWRLGSLMRVAGCGLRWAWVIKLIELIRSIELIAFVKFAALISSKFLAGQRLIGYNRLQAQ